MYYDTERNNYSNRLRYPMPSPLFMPRPVSPRSDFQSPEPPPIKQTWEEFCREQQCIKNSTQSNPNANTSSASYRPGTTTTPTDSYRTYQQPNNARPNPNSSKWQTKNNYKRTTDQEPLLKTAKKRKKPLSQNVPTKKEWSLKDAERALLIETECNKRSKSSLIIKFPDLELNRDIVAAFHTDIENVHFQQPSTPRFCFVTLKDNANMDEIISTLNKQKFGDGYIVAEHKKDREEDQAVSARDVDPYTLYVGNLAQEITKEDMVHLYPSSRRIDIGYAKKMKYTRYAFVVFHTIDDAIESFKKTHNHQIYNKSLIVRFRRLHGTVGMPGDNKQQNPPKQQPEKKGDSQKTNEDIQEVGYNDSRISPFVIKQEACDNVDYEDDYSYYDDEDYETNLSQHPKSIKFEVKGEFEPEVFEYGPDSKMGIKDEMKGEHKFEDPEDIDLSDVDGDTDSDYYGQDEVIKNAVQLNLKLI